jgi:hypothetical protein
MKENVVLEVFKVIVLIATLISLQFMCNNGSSAVDSFKKSCTEHKSFGWPSASKHDECLRMFPELSK